MNKELTNNQEDGRILKAVVEIAREERRKEFYPTAEELLK